jgi:hypothetical protein
MRAATSNPLVCETHACDNCVPFVLPTDEIGSGGTFGRCGMPPCDTPTYGNRTFCIRHELEVRQRDARMARLEAEAVEARMMDPWYLNPNRRVEILREGEMPRRVESGNTTLPRVVVAEIIRRLGGEVVIDERELSALPPAAILEIVRGWSDNRQSVFRLTGAPLPARPAAVEDVEAKGWPSTFKTCPECKFSFEPVHADECPVCKLLEYECSGRRSELERERDGWKDRAEAEIRRNAGVVQERDQARRRADAESTTRRAIERKYETAQNSIRELLTQKTALEEENRSYKEQMRLWASSGKAPAIIESPKQKAIKEAAAEVKFVFKSSTGDDCSDLFEKFCALFGGKVLGHEVNIKERLGARYAQHAFAIEIPEPVDYQVWLRALDRLAVPPTRAARRGMPYYEPPPSPPQFIVDESLDGGTEVPF